FGPKPLDDLDPFVGQIITLIMIEARAPKTDVRKIEITGASYKIQADAAWTDLVKRGHHLGNDSRLIHSHVYRTEYADPSRRLKQCSSRPQRLQRTHPVFGWALISPPNAGAEHKIKSQRLCILRHVEHAAERSVFDCRGIRRMDPTVIADRYE